MMKACEKRTPAFIGGIVLLILSMAAALGYGFLHPSFLSPNYVGLPGAGWAVTQWAVLAGAMFIITRRDRSCLKRNGAGWFLLLAALLLGACYAIYGNQSMRLMNFPVMMMVSIQALFAFSRHHGEAPLSGRGWLLALGRFFSLPFCHVLWPFRALAEGARQNGNRLRGVLLGLLLGLPVLALAIYLLAGADAMFEHAFSSAFGWLGQIDGGFLSRLVSSLMIGLLLFSLLYGAALTVRLPKERKPLRLRASAFLIALSGLAILYALFAYIQFRYLFGGLEAVAMKGGYAEYARSGFFQLVLLSCITLGLLLPGLSLCGDSKMVRILGAAVAVLTMVMDASAFYRMRLYIQSYGLTVLRLVTLWGMLAILIALVLSLVKCITPAFRLCPVLTATLLVTWLALNFANVDACIARYQVRAWNRGEIEQMDLQYLSILSPDVLPALEQIEDEAVRTKAVSEVTEGLEGLSPSGAYDWSFSWLHFVNERPENTP